MGQRAPREHVERELLTVEQAGELLNVGRTTVFRLLNEGALPRLRIGNLVRIPTDEVRSYIARQLEASDDASAA